MKGRHQKRSNPERRRQNIREREIFISLACDGPLMRIASMKKLIEALPDKHDELTQFAKKEKLGIKEESDLKKLIKYHTSL